MAKTDGTPLRLTCAGCSTAWDWLRPAGQRGRAPKWCGDACRADAQKASALKSGRKRRAAGYKEPAHVCAACGGPRARKAQRCRACDATKRSRLDYWHSCERCGLAFHARPGGAAKRGDRFGRWCSHRCRSDAFRLVRDEAASLRRIAHAWRPVPKPGIRDSGIGCKVCGTLFCRLPGQWNRGYCSTQCYTTGRAIADKARRRVYKARRRALERGANAERIDPIAVFERDKWKCHLCGKHSPRLLRGTYNELAPELDHVVPLASGGGHTWSNVRLAHRMCNAAKRDKPMGQLMLDGFAVADRRTSIGQGGGVSLAQQVG